MFMIRSFLPVGQGAFYLEQFGCQNERINIVYDCGSLTSIEHVKREIQSNLEQDETIHAVFISHLDSDHVNGIKYLLNYCNVKNIFLPLLTERNKKIMTLKYLVESPKHTPDDFFYKFVENPYDVIGHEQNIYYILDYNNDNEYANDNFLHNREYLNHEIVIDTNTDAGLERLKNIILETGDHKQKSLYFGDWLFVPFNFKQEDRVAQLIVEIEDRFNKPFDALDISQILYNKKNRKKLKDAYSAIDGNINSNSMTVFSGAKTKKLLQHSSHNLCCQWCCPPYCDMNDRYCGCLYTGDYNARPDKEWNALRHAYDSYWKYIGCFQIPHHGSARNYNPNIATNNAYYVVSAGYNNSHKHPHAKVVKDFLYKDLSLNVVTEHVNSVMRLVVYNY